MASFIGKSNHPFCTAPHQIEYVVGRFRDKGCENFVSKTMELNSNILIALCYDTSEKAIFYTILYHLLLSPTAFPVSMKDRQKLLRYSANSCAKLFVFVYLYRLLVL